MDPAQHDRQQPGQTYNRRMTPAFRAVEAWGLTLTPEIARQIRAWRADDEYTYRAIAARADETWGSHSNGNQLFGRDLCIASAEILGENHTTDPWN
jgi:hypothetical protein